MARTTLNNRTINRSNTVAKCENDTYPTKP